MALAKQKKELALLASKTEKIDKLLNEALAAIHKARVAVTASYSEKKHRNVFFGSWRMTMVGLGKDLSYIDGKLNDVILKGMGDATDALEEADTVISQREDW